MATEHTTTGTAADLLTYEKYHNTAGYDYLSRVATASEEWIVSDLEGEQYCIRFDKNFSKKHLFTFSKKEEWKGSDRLKHKSLFHKIQRVIDVRSNIRLCKTCGHPEAKHKTASGAPTPCKFDVNELGDLFGGIPAQCGCNAFVDVGGADVHAYFRSKAGKPEHSVLGGASTDINSCIVLNYVPKAEFEDVVVRSIVLHEKPTLWNAPGQPYHGRAWQRGDPLGVTTDPTKPHGHQHQNNQRLLVWNFAVGRTGVVLQATANTKPKYWPKLHRCTVLAEKTHSEFGRQTWKIVHLHSAP